MPWERQEFAALHLLSMEPVYLKCGRYTLQLSLNYSYKLIYKCKLVNKYKLYWDNTYKLFNNMHALSFLEWNELLLQRAEHTISKNCPQAAPSGSSSKSLSSEQHLVQVRTHYKTFSKSVPSTINDAACGSPPPHPHPLHGPLCSLCPSNNLCLMYHFSFLSLAIHIDYRKKRLDCSYIAHPIFTGKK